MARKPIKKILRPKFFLTIVDLAHFSHKVQRPFKYIQNLFLLWKRACIKKTALQMYFNFWKIHSNIQYMHFNKKNLKKCPLRGDKLDYVPKSRRSTRSEKTWCQKILINYHPLCDKSRIPWTTKVIRRIYFSTNAVVL